MTIRHLLIFIQVAETKNMSAAAEKLYISQPSVSQAIRELEKHYDTLLFERLNRRLYITEAGKRLLSYARSIASQFDLMEMTMRSENQVEHLRIGSTITIASCLLPGLLNTFHRLRSQVDVTASIGNTHLMEEKLLSGELDVGIIEGQVKSPDLVSIPVIEDFLVLACASDHPLAQKQVVTFGDLESADFVMREQGSGTRELFETYLKKNGVRIRTRVEAPFPEAMKNAILLNGCLGAISVRLLEAEIRSGVVHIICPPGSQWKRSFNIAYHKDKFISPSITFLLNLLEQNKTPDFMEGIRCGLLEG